MKTLTKLMLAAALTTTALAAAAPAGAQDFGWRPPPPPYGGVASVDYRFGGELRDREARLGRWIGDSAREGRLAAWQARNAWGSLHAIRDREQSLRWRQGGRLYPDQVGALNARLDGLADFVRRANAYDRRW